MYIRGSFFSILAVAGMTTLNVSTALFAEHKICILGHKVLLQKAEPIKKFGGDLDEPISTMLQTLYATNGVGLAAPQVGLSCQIVVIDDPRLAALRKPEMEQKRIAFEEKEAPFFATKAVLIKKGKDGKGKIESEIELKNIFDIFPLVLVNPRVSFIPDEEDISREGCLSLPGIMKDILRKRKIVVEYRDRDGEEYGLKCDGLLAKIIQHEVDHLNGILYVDRPDKQPLLVRGWDPIWKREPKLYGEMQKLKDETLTKEKIPQFEQMLEERFGLKGDKEETILEPSKEDEEKIEHMLKNVFWISEKDTGKALKIIEEIGGEDHILDYDTLLQQSGTVNDAVKAESE